MKDTANNCATLTDISETLVASTTGSYLYGFEIEFTGMQFAGKIPPLTISYSTVSLDWDNVNFEAARPDISLTSKTVGGVTKRVGTLKTTGVAEISVAGNQPDGNVQLTYYCEKRTQVTTVDVLTTTTVQITLGLTAHLALYQWIRIENSYHQITSILTGTD